jgi:hypothetical protein
VCIEGGKEGGGGIANNEEEGKKEERWDLIRFSLIDTEQGKTCVLANITCAV